MQIKNITNDYDQVYQLPLNLPSKVSHYMFLACGLDAQLTIISARHGAIVVLLIFDLDLYRDTTNMVFYTQELVEYFCFL